MPLLLRAIITGFGYKLGAEMGRYVATRIGLVKPEAAAKEQKDEDIPDGITHVDPDEPLDEDEGTRQAQSDDDDA